MNIGVIFAGGVGKRMNSRVKPKQFIDVYGKPIIIHTLELFENHPGIDAIAVACLEDWIPYLQELLEKFNIKKVKKVVPGGASGQESIYNGLRAAEEIAAGEKSIVLIHDGVRPLINEKTITDNIESVKKYGSSITCVKVKETVLVVGEDNSIEDVTKRAGIPLDKVVVNIDHYGNTSAATIPLALWDAESKLKKGDNIIFTAFGAGFVHGASFYKWAYDGSAYGK